MGFLLLQYEFQRATREANFCDRKTIRINNQLTRATKRIEKMEAIFSKAKSAIDSKYTNLQSTITRDFSNLSTVVTTNLSGQTTPGAYAASQLNNAFQQVVIGGVRLSTLVSVSTIDTSGCGSDQSKINSTIMSAMNTAISQATNILSQMIENAKSAEQAELEVNQDAQLAPLSDKESDLQAEQSLNDTLKTLWEQRRDNAHDNLSKAIENSTGHFGLK